MEYTLDAVGKALEYGSKMYDHIELYADYCETTKDGWYEYCKLYDLLSWAYDELKEKN